MGINDLTLGQVRELQGIFNARLPVPAPAHPLLGKNVIVRTITMIYTGKLVEVTPQDLVLVDCSWIPETERYMKFVAEGAVKECEPYPDGLPVYIGQGTVLDKCELRKELPRSQK